MVVRLARVDDRDPGAQGADSSGFVLGYVNAILAISFDNSDCAI